MEQGKKPGVNRGRRGSGTSQRAGMHPNPGLSTSLGLKESKIMDKDKTGGKNPAWSLSLMGAVPVPPQDSAGGRCWGQG